jgi:hypothetical protein
MLKKIGFIFFVVVVSIVFSCKKETNDGESWTVLNKKEKKFSWKDFKNGGDTLVLDSVAHLGDDAYPEMYISDTLLFYINPYTKDKFVTCTNLKGKVLKKFIKKGKGPNEVFSIFILGFLNNKKILYAVDNSLYRIAYLYKITDILGKKKVKPIKVIEIGEGYDFISGLITENRLINTNDTSKYKLQIVDSLKHLVRNIGKYNMNITKNNSYYVNTAFERMLELNEKRNKIAVVYYNTDILEIYDTTGNQLFVGQGPDNINLESFTPSLAKSTDSYGIVENKSKNAYTSIKSDKKYIYTEYNGRTATKSNVFTDHYILVFDWTGKPIKYFYIKKPISSFSVDEKNNVLYCYDTDNGNLYKAKLDLPK